MKNKKFEDLLSSRSFSKSPWGTLSILFSFLMLFLESDPSPFPDLISICSLFGEMLVETLGILIFS